ncbi:hypothetical protein G6F46_004833 [Rhizopus delemar]|uniref:Uncharacterized protein n=2 Tax=Rhizopus TaxID=4842 RepID=A0A9P7CQW9_9FUNG|nr:hypothetical protein G6F55_004255 [Rhizopus delemar]KAG1544499.1 hypothetical protein G6F51_006025 [Rhizopus arrhizus]KAG1498516.1 hypothetical protein G6F54_005031 [Rhizopus delemar]KAG1512283.1 hypothetical protein G6F53_005302 [Rhizopus delemar]KAG1521190.1 hypothetical protein G6F52_006967 [Rhizopus delemar]
MQLSNVLSIFYPEHLFKYEASVTIMELICRSRFSERENFASALASQGFLWDHVDPNNLYLDLGVNFGSPQHGLSGMWSTGNSTNFRAIIDNFLAPEETFLSRKYRHDPFCNHLGIGGFKYSSPKSDFIRITAYSHSKEPFYRRSTMGERHGDDFQPDEVLRVSPHFIKQVKKMKYCLSLMKSSSYGVRFEVRFTADHWDVLYDHTMDLAKNHLHIHINWYKSGALTAFVEKRLDSLVALAKNFQAQSDCRYTARQLTGVAVIAFMLSSLVHRPLDRSWWKPFADQLKAKRCRKSMALFTPDLFRLSEDGSRWSCTVSLRQSLDGVLHKDIVNKMIPELADGIELPEWHYKFPMLLEQNSTINDLNFDLGLYDQCIDLVNKENYYWDRAVLYIGYYGLSDDCMEPFAHLVMHELINKFTKWDRYCKDQQSYEKLYKYGSNFFCTKSYLNEILKVPSQIVIQLGY